MATKYVLRAAFQIPLVIEWYNSNGQSIFIMTNICVTDPYIYPVAPVGDQRHTDRSSWFN